MARSTPVWNSTGTGGTAVSAAGLRGVQLRSAWTRCDGARSAAVRVRTLSSLAAARVFGSAMPRRGAEARSGGHRARNPPADGAGRRARAGAHVAASAKTEAAMCANTTTFLKSDRQ